MKEEKTKRGKFIYAFVLAISACLLIAATVLTVYFIAERDGDHVIENPVPDNGSTVKPKPEEPENPDQPTGGEISRFVNPVDSDSVSVYDEIYYNETTGWFYRHKAVDFAASAGDNVQCIADGTVKEISLNDKTGNYIIVDHGDNLESLYRFVDADTSLKVGQSVKKGQAFATVSGVCGSEYRDGAHLHLELTENGKQVDPAAYLDISYPEK